MIEATQLKNGVTFKVDGKPYRVLKYFHQKIGRGGATVKLSTKNLQSGNNEEMTLNSNSKVEEIDTLKRSLQFLYGDESEAVFMDPATFEQVELPIAIIKDELKFLKDGEMVNVLFWEDKVLTVELPPKVALKVEKTTPGVKGNSATNMFKPATLENGLSIKVPLFINEGDRVRVDTRTGEYVERVK